MLSPHRRFSPTALLAMCVTGLMFIFGEASWAQAVRPGIVLVIADDLGINDLQCYGRREHQTPNLDRLAAEGMRFTAAYAAQPVCSPSRAALMTGKTPARLHLTSFLPGRPDADSQKLLQPVIEGQLPTEEMTLAEWLQRSGYRTGMFGKWHLGDGQFGPKAQGFETVATPPANTEPSDTEGGKGEFAITEAAENFIENNRDQPFFCYVAHNNPHIPLAAQQSLAEKHAATFHPTYAAMIETLDEAVGRLMRKVEQLGLSERTIFLFTSDNGGLHVLEYPGTPATHNSPYRAGKGFLYEGGIREPLIVRWPSMIRPGSTSDTPVVLTDLVPTLLQAAGIDQSKTVGPLDGVSLLPLWRGETMPQRDLFWHFPHYSNQGNRPAGAIRSGDWKLVEHFEDGRLELFDLANDISETNNLAEQQPERALHLQQQLAAWRTSVGAQMPEPNPEFDSALYRQLSLDKDPSQLAAGRTAAEMQAEWSEWRRQLNQVVAGRKPRVTPPTGDIRLQAKDAIVHAETMRYEPESHKNVLGYWVNPKDWAEWKFNVPAAGRYEVEVQQGCGKGCGGAEVDVEVGGKTLSFTVVETGHFQQMIQISVGEVELPAGNQTLAIKPRTKPGPAVMDIRRVVLRLR
ncbi:MAG: sulfatase-like hydrolase/transferase [Planctomycetota bacterium]